MPKKHTSYLLQISTVYLRETWKVILQLNVRFQNVLITVQHLALILTFIYCR